MPETPSRLPVRSRPSITTTEDSNNKRAASPSIAPAQKRHALPTKFVSQSTRTASTNNSTTTTNNNGNSKTDKPTASLVTAKWDTKARVEGMEDTINTLTNALNLKTELENALTGQIESLKEHCNKLEEESRTLVIQLKEKESCFNTMVTEESEKVKELEHCIKELGERNDYAEQKLLDTEKKLSNALSTCDNLQSNINTKSTLLMEMETQMHIYKMEQNRLLNEIIEWKRMDGEAKKQIEFLSLSKSDLYNKLQLAEKTRRKLHNQVQELRGNIRVFCRTRPRIDDEPDSETIDIVHSPDDVEQITLKTMTEGSLSNNQKSHQFSFDRVFGPEANQEVVFEEISQLVQSALDGYRVCIFAYGQTGSGKTFTMEGRPDAPGMIPLAVQQIFNTATILETERGWHFSFEVSYLEIYNESIRDLLGNNLSGDDKHEIRHINGNTTVTDLIVQPVHNQASVMTILQTAGRNRAVAETLCNDRSSRSHSVFTLKITGENVGTKEKVDGLLNLIDLAGSERLSQSGSTGDRLKETQAINKSLSALGDVIAALASKEAHVPFRNSKLTFLLQNSLGGNCKTLMFVNISPVPASIPETLCSLRFAQKVNACHIGVARKQVTNHGNKKP